MKLSRRCLLAALWAASAVAVAADRPYDPDADAKAQIRQALQQAVADQRPVLLIFGANWCEDCRALDQALQAPRDAALIGTRFRLVKVDIGNFDRNLDIAKAYDDPIRSGIPAAVVVSPDNRVLYLTRGGELADARRMSEDGIYQFFRKLADDAAPAAAPR